MKPIKRSRLKTNHGKFYPIRQGPMGKGHLSTHSNHTSDTSWGLETRFDKDYFFIDESIYVTQINSIWTSPLYDLCIGANLENKQRGTIQHIYVESVSDRIRIFGEYHLKELIINQPNLNPEAHLYPSIILVGTPNIENLVLKGPLQCIDIDVSVYHRFKTHIDSLDVKGQIRLYY